MADAAASNNHTVPTTTTTSAVCERQIDSEYKIWKKNTPFLYDFVLTHGLEWPSLTVEWLPTVTPVRSTTTTGGSSGGPNSAGGCEIHQLLIGTHTAGEQNHLMIATSVLPRDNHHPDNEMAAATSGGTGGVATANLRYDEEKKEVGGYGLHHNTNTSQNRVGKMEIKMKINHEGEVHRARYMPQNHFIVASRGPAPELYIWDFAKHPSFPPENDPTFCPQAICVGHTKDGYAMAWSPHEEGKLASGSEDANLLLWDVRAGLATKGPGTPIHPIRTYASSIHTHTATIEDVAWHSKDAHIIGTVSDDASLCIWDIRSESTKPMQRVVQAHSSDINCLAFNPVAEFTVATGGAGTFFFSCVLLKKTHFGHAFCWTATLLTHNLSRCFAPYYCIH
jgi:WD40 repeat protein